MKYQILYIFLLTSGIAMAQQTANINANKVFKDSVDMQARKAMTDLKIIGAQVAVIQDDQTLFQQSYGYSDLKNNIETNDKIRFRVGSISKVFTAFSVMQLVEQGKVDLNTPIEHYLPTLHLQSSASFRKITVKDLLTHTSGITDDIINNPNCGKKIAQGDLIDLANLELLTVPPGRMKIYSNVGFGLLGCLIEEVSKLSYGSYVKKYIFEPLGMDNSTVSEMMGAVPGRTKGYLKDSTEIEENALRDIAAGGIESSMPDLIKFAQMLLHESKGTGTMIVRKETFAEMTRNHLEDLTLATDEVFGYGLFIHPLGTNQDSIIGGGIGHAGDLRLHHSLLFVYPKLGIGIVILTNSEQGAKMRNRLSQKIIADYLTVYKGITLTPMTPKQFSPQSRAADHLDHKQLEGIYGGGGEEYVQLRKMGKNKIRFKQGKSTLILRRNDQNLYTTKYKLLNIIPLPVKNLLFAFKEEGDRIYMKALDNKHKTAQLLSVKDPALPFSAAWKSREGAYEVVNGCPNAITMKPIALKYLRNKILLYRKDYISDDEDNIGFNPLNDTIAVSDGVDRGSGAVLRVLPNGNLYYSGFELKRADDGATITVKK